MIEQIEKLHTAARRYCIDNHCYWFDKYFALDEIKRFENSDDTNEAYSIFPRYNALNDILIELERFQPNDFGTVEEAKEMLLLISSQEDSLFTKSAKNEIAKKVRGEEFQKLYDFIDQITCSDLEKVEPLFFRRVLSKSESENLREKVRDVWNADGYWFPLSTSKPQNTEAFQDKYFELEFGLEKLRQILSELKIEKVFVLNEDNINYEMEIAIIEPCYNLSESFWFDESCEWLIYASHESSVTFAGTVLPKIKESWSNWQERVWTSPFFD